MPRLGPSLLALAAALIVGCAVDSPPATAAAQSAADTSSGDASAAPDAGPIGPDTPETDASPGADTAAALPFCKGTTRHLHDPLGEALLTFPDDAYTQADASSPTGRRPRLDLEVAPWLETLSPLFRPNFEALNRLSGFGTGTGVILRFSAPVTAFPSGAEASLASDAVQWLDLSQTPPKKIPFHTMAQDIDSQNNNASVILYPLIPLREDALHAVIVTTQHLAADGGCIQPAPATVALLTGVDVPAGLDHLRPGYQKLLQATGLSPQDLSVAVTFTTHADSQALLKARADIQSRSYTWIEPPTCEDLPDFRRCEGSFVAWDYRVDGMVTTGEPQAQWTLPVTLWLPHNAPGPAPVLVFGHGINSRRQNGEAAAKRYIDLGLAVIASDALQHGQHPTATDGDSGDDVFRFLGVDLASFSFDLAAARGNFNQTVLDRLQLVALIKDAPDLDNDGVAELDPTRMAYYGISLGGLLGVGLMALSDDFDTSILTVAGGGLLNFAIDNIQFQPFKPVLVGMVGSQEEFDRQLAVVESLIDAADPATWATHVLDDRFTPTSVPPHLLFNVAIPDDTVPPSTGYALARALQIPHLPPVVVPVDTLTLSAEAPLTGNLHQGATTAAYFQFDRVGGATPKPAGHNNVPYSAEAVFQKHRFLETWLGTDAPPVIVDPYAELGTAPLP